MRSLTEMRLEVNYDISPPIGVGTRVWPGDTPPEREVLLDMSKGDNITLSTLRTTVHVGSHVDAPSHYAAKGASVESLPLENYIGHCQVIGARVELGERVSLEHLDTEIGSERVLIRTGTFEGHDKFNEDFAGLEPGLIEELAARGVRLVGIDTPSVDLLESKDLPAHAACRQHDVAILEGIVLTGVPSGFYELIALPLKLVGFDASPVRAILRRL